MRLEPDRKPAVVLEKLKACWDDNSDGRFEDFRSAWHPYLEAALARFIDDWESASTVCDLAYFDYREAFKKPFRPNFDYLAYFLAIAYTHLLRTSGSTGMEQLSIRLGLTIDRDANDEVLVFAAILRLPEGCIFDLLNQCFNSFWLRVNTPAGRPCETELGRVLRLVLVRK